MATSVHREATVEAWPLYWFAYLERAIRQGDFALADRAQRRLKALGVTVVYRPRPARNRRR
jgi:hypothetical protein